MDAMAQDRSERFETFVTWYLRFNGYFTVPSFVVHAGDDPSRISEGVVGNLTEVDTLAIRLPYSREESGVRFPTDKNLVEGAEGLFDLIIAEVKSGKSDSPNRIWRNGATPHIEYLLKFVGWHWNGEDIRTAAKKLAENYALREPNLRVRYIVFAKQVDPVWSKKGVRYITFDECIKFISEERGQSWARAGIGRRSMHDQWNPLIKRIFEIANEDSLEPARRCEQIQRVLDEGWPIVR